MNEQAVKDSYELFKTGGYAKSFDEFVELINTNPQALQDSYDLFQTGGYSKSMDDYQALMGLKKKDEAMDSSLGDGSLEPSVQEATETPDFSQSITAVTPGLIAQEEEEVVPDMRGQFGKYGFTFNETGIGDAMTVTTTDGSASIDVDLDTFTNAGAEKESQRLRQFMNANATAPVELETDNLLDQAYRAQNMREKAMRNNDGTESTVEFMSYEQDGKYKVAPTLFPINPDNYNSDGRTWMRLNTDEAIQTAEERGEVFTFDTEEEANAFAEGSWKDVAPVEIEAQYFFRERDRDYVSDQAALQEYEALRDERIFLEDSDNTELVSLTEEEKALYSQHYTDGALRDDVDSYVDSIEQREDTLFDAVMDDDAMTAREDFDVYLNKRQGNIASQAASINQSAKSKEAILQKNSMDSFGIPVEELVKYEPKNEREREYANYIISEFNSNKQAQQQAAMKYDQAKTYLDAKHDKNVYAEFTENWQGFTDGVSNAWNSGWAAEAMMAYEMSGKMPENQDEAAAIISERMSQMKPGQARAMSRIDRSVGVKEWWDAFSDDPLEVTSNYVASSLSMLLPLGMTIIPASVATGAAGGAMFAGVGAVAGAGAGLYAGQAAAGAALEYTNAILDSMRENEYDLSDPSQVVAGLNDEKVMEDGRRIGKIRGLTIGAFNLIGGALAGRVFTTSGLASVATRALAQGAERMVFDPVVEGTGELAAQVFSGQEINWKEVAAESIGGLGNNTPNAFINVYSQTRNRSDIATAHQLTDIDYISSEKASDQRINDWAVNMRKLGKIDAETEQRILENVGARRDALKTLGVGPKSSRTSSPEVVSRLMALEEAKKQLSDANKEAFSSQISEINKEISQIGLTKKIVKDGVTIDDLVPELLRKPDVPLYKVGKKFMTRAQFIEHITDMTPQQKAKLEKQGYAVRNDVEVVELVKQTLEPDAVQEQSPGDISENKLPEDIQEVEEEVSRQQEPTTEEVETLEGEVSDLESELGIGVAPDVDVVEEAAPVVEEAAPVVEEAAPEVDPLAAQSARDAQLLEDTPDSVVELFENWTKSLFSPEVEAIENKEPSNRTRSERAKLAAVTRRMNKALAAAEAAGLDNSAQVELGRAVQERPENQEAAPVEAAPVKKAAPKKAAPKKKAAPLPQAAQVKGGLSATDFKKGDIIQDGDGRTYEVLGEKDGKNHTKLKVLDEGKLDDGKIASFANVYKGFALASPVAKKAAPKKKAEGKPKQKKGESDQQYFKRVAAWSKATQARKAKEEREAKEKERAIKEATGAPEEMGVSPSAVAKAKAEQKIKDDMPSFDPLDYDDRVVEIEEEIAIEKGNTTEKIASVKKEVAKIKANKKLSAAKKKEKIAELKEELNEFKEDQADLIDSYRDDIKAVKAEKKADEKEFNKAKKDAEKKGVRFRLQDEQDQIEEYDVDAIVDEMNELGPAQMEFTTPTASQKGLEVNPIEESKSSVKITEEQAKELGFESVADMLKTIETFNGIPMLPAMSDMLASGKTKDSEGKSMRLDGGLLFNILGSNKDLAWAGVTKEGAQEMYDNAVKLYESNKDLFESLWEEGRLPNGHIPLMVLRMGNPSVNSNEAVFRFILPTIKKGENQEQAMTLLNESVEAKTKVDNKAVRRDAASLKAFIEKKNITTVSQLLQEVIKDIKKRAKGDYKNTLPLSARGLLYDVMFSAEGAVTNSRPYAKTLFPGNKEVLQKLTSNFIYKGIGEPSMLKSKQGEGVAVMGVDVLNGGVRKADHNNYGFGPKGRVIALIKNPKHGIDMFAEWAAKAPRIFKLTKPKKGGPEKLPSQEDVVRQTGGAFFTDAAFKGAKVLSEQISDLNLLIGKLRFAFPSVAVATTKKEFDAIVSRPGVKTRKIEGKTILGITMEGKVWVNPDAASLATPIHEFGHIWVDYLRSKDSGKKGDVLLAKGFELVKGTKAYESAKRKYGDTELALEEALVELIATKGETIVNAAQKSKFKSWLNAMYEFIKEKFIRSADIKINDVQDMTLDSFVNTALADLFGGVAVSSTFDPSSISEAARARYETVDAESKGLAESIRMIPDDSSIPMTDIIQYGRSKGYSDASIRELLKRQGYDVKTINDGITEYTEPSIIVPAVFGNVEGGMDTGKAIYQSVVQQLNEFAEVTQENKTKKTAKEIRQKAMAILRENEAFNEQSPSTQRELLIAMNDSLSVATNKDVSREMKQLRHDIRQGKAAIKNLKEYQTRLRRLIRQEMKQTGLISRSRVNRLLASVANTTEKNFYAQAQKVLNTIDEQREAEKKLVINDLIKYTKKQAKKAKTASGRTRTRGLDAVGQLYFETLTRVLTIAASPNKQMRMSAIANLQQKLNESEVLQSALVKVKNNEQLTLPEEKALDQSIALDAWGSIADMTLEEVRASVAIIKSEATASRAVLNEKRLREAAQVEDLEVEAVAEVKKLAPILFDEEGNPLSKEEVMRQRTNILKQYKEGSFKEKFEAVKQYVSTMRYSELMKSARSNFNIVKHLGTLMNEMGPWFKDNVYDRLNVSRRNYLQGLDDQRTKLDEIANSVKGITKGYREVDRMLYSPVKDEIAELTIQGKKYQFNKSQLMWLYSLSKNDVQRAMLEEQGVPIEKIEEFLGPQLIDFSDKVVTYLSQDYFESVNKVYKDVNNINLTQIENYFPTRKISDDNMTDIIAQGDFSKVFNAMFATALKERTAVKGKIPLQTYNFTDLLENHFDSMERFKAFAYTTRDLNKIFSFPAVVTLMDSLGINSLVKQHINHAINPSSVQGEVVGPKAIAWFQRKFVGSILGLKMAQMWKQASSFIAAFEQYEAFPGKKFPGREVAELTSFLLESAKMYAFDLPIDIIRMAQGKESAGPLSLARSISPEFRDRLKKSLQNDIQSLAGGQTPTYTEQQRYKALSRTRRALKSAVGGFTAMGDLLGVLGYMVTYKRNIKNGMSPEKAAIRFDDYNATQQSKRETERNQLQQSRSVFTRMFTMFGSATFLLMNNVMQSSKNIGRSVSKGETPKRTDIRKLYLNLGLVNAVFYGTAYAAKLAGSSSDKDEWLKRVRDSLFGLNLMYSVPLLGAAAETASEFIQEGEVPRMSSGGGIDPISSALTNTLRNINDSKLDTYEKLVPMVSLLAGANLEPIVALGEMASGTNIDGDEMYEVMGIPKSQRPS